MCECDTVGEVGKHMALFELKRNNGSTRTWTVCENAYVVKVPLHISTWLVFRKYLLEIFV